MRIKAVLGIAVAIFLSSCATNPLHVPPRPHAMPSRPRPTPEAVAAESRPAELPAGFDSVEGEDWRTGDSVTFALEFDDGHAHSVFWLELEVAKTPVGLPDAPRALVKTTLLDKDGTVIGSARRRVDPARIAQCGQEIFEDCTAIVASALSDEDPEKILAKIEEDLGEGTAFEEARNGLFRELRKTAPRFVREKLKEPAIKASLGSISVLDLAMAAVSKIEVLIDVNQLKGEQDALVNFEDVPVKAIRMPYILTIGGSILFRFAVTLAAPSPPYALTGGILELAGVNEACGERHFLLRVVSAKRGSAPESRPESRAESQPSLD